MMAHLHSDDMYIAQDKILLVPAFSDAGISSIPRGIAFRAEIVDMNGREAKTLGGYFLELKNFINQMPESAQGLFWQNTLRHLSIFRSIDVMLLHDLLKSILGVKSIAYGNMTEQEVKEFKKAAFFLLEEFGSSWGYNRGGLQNVES